MLLFNRPIVLCLSIAAHQVENIHDLFKLGELSLLKLKASLSSKSHIIIGKC